MAEFLEVPIRREDGSEALHFINVEAISCVDYQEAGQEKGCGTLKIHLNNGYWFTISGSKAEEVLSLVKTRVCILIKSSTGTN